MPRRRRIDYAGAVHHVAVNGNNGQPMFLGPRDRRLCLFLLAETAERYEWDVWAYCQLTTHWHLIVRTPEKTLTPGMRRMNSLYARNFNARHGRTGHSLRHRFMSVPVEHGEHLRELTRYLPLNPVRAGLVSHPEAWVWSSYRAELGITPGPAWLRTTWWEKAHQTTDRLRRWVAKGMAEPDAQWAPGSDPTLTRPRPAG